MLLNCTDCEGFIPLAARECPHCGGSISSRRRRLRKVAGAAAGAATMMTLMACYGLPCGPQYGNDCGEACVTYDAFTGNCCDDEGLDENGDLCCEARDPSGNCCEDGLDSTGECAGDDPQFSTCGNGIVEVNEQCDDANNQDGDGCSASCAVELCRDTTPLVVGTQPVVTSDASSDFFTQCADGFGGLGNERVLRYDAAVPGTLSLALSDASQRHGMYAAYSCAPSGLVSGGVSPAGAVDMCAGPAESGAATLELPVHPDGPLYVVVDAVDASSAGEASLEATFAPACGNAIVSEWANEDCDDGNTQDGDGCSATCTIEYDVICANAIAIDVGDTFGDTSDGKALANGPNCLGPEDLYVYTPQQDGALTVVVSSESNLSLSVGAECDASSLQSGACIDEQPGGTAEVQVTLVTAGEPVFVRVDGATASDAGSYTLSLQQLPLD